MKEDYLEKNPLTTGIDQEILGTSGTSLSFRGVPFRRQARAKGEPFLADHKDGFFALVAFVLGFFFARWVLFSWQGWGVTAFTFGYSGAVTLYLLKKGVHISREGWFLKETIGSFARGKGSTVRY